MQRAGFKKAASANGSDGAAGAAGSTAKTSPFAASSTASAGDASAARAALYNARERTRETLIAAAAFALVVAFAITTHKIGATLWLALAARIAWRCLVADDALPARRAPRPALKGWTRHAEDVESVRRDYARFLETRNAGDKVALRRSAGGVADSNRTLAPLYKKKAAAVDVSRLAGVIAVDLEKRLLHVEPGAPQDELAAAALARGLVPAVVPEFPGITAGGAFSGGGIESTSAAEGSVADTVESLDVITGDGRFLTGVSRTNHPDLFAAAAAGFGTVGEFFFLQGFLFFFPSKERAFAGPAAHSLFLLSLSLSLSSLSLSVSFFSLFLSFSSLPLSLSRARSLSISNKGIITRLALRCVRAPKFVTVSYLHLDGTRSAAAALERLALGTSSPSKSKASKRSLAPPEFLDGVALGPRSAVVVVGTPADAPPACGGAPLLRLRSSRTAPWFFWRLADVGRSSPALTGAGFAAAWDALVAERGAESPDASLAAEAEAATADDCRPAAHPSGFPVLHPAEYPGSVGCETLPLEDYLFRFDRGAFWMARHGLQMFYGRAAWRDEKGDPEVVSAAPRGPAPSSSGSLFPKPLGPPTDPTERAGPAPLIRAKYAWLATTRQLYRMLHHVGVGFNFFNSFELFSSFFFVLEGEGEEKARREGVERESEQKTHSLFFSPQPPPHLSRASFLSSNFKNRTTPSRAPTSSRTSSCPPPRPPPSLSRSTAPLPTRAGSGRSGSAPSGTCRSRVPGGQGTGSLTRRGRRPRRGGFG